MAALRSLTVLSLLGAASATVREDEALLARIPGLEQEWADARAASEQALALTAPLPPNLWQECEDLPVLDNTCTSPAFCI